MKRYLFPLVALVLGGALIALSQFTTPPGSSPPNTNGVSNANASNTNAVVNGSGNVNAVPPPANTNASPAPSNTNTAPTALPSKVTLDVPFTSQAPTGNWSPEFNDACEEASALMVATYLLKEPMPSASETEKVLLAIESWETANLGHWESTTAAETERFIEGFWPGLNAEVRTLTSMDQVKAELAAGNPVILPANGRELGNPNFRQPGPPYHMLVVTGYDSKGFITNDPGTRRGEDYRYAASTLFDATHDWEGSGVANGPKVYITVFK